MMSTSTSRTADRSDDRADARTEGTIQTDARAWAEHARQKGCRFDVEKKAAQSIDFTRRAQAHSFGLATKLRGTAKYQANLDTVAFHLETRQLRWAELAIEDLGEGDEYGEGGGLLVTWENFHLGFIQDKHVKWLRPLLRTGRVRLYLLCLTGGTADKPLRGVNVAIAGVGEALDELGRGYRWRVRLKQPAHPADA